MPADRSSPMPLATSDRGRRRALQVGVRRTAQGRAAATASGDETSSPWAVKEIRRRWNRAISVRCPMLTQVAWARRASMGHGEMGGMGANPGYSGPMGAGTNETTGDPMGGARAPSTPP